MNKKKLLLCILLMLAILYVLPPIMFAKGAPIIGKKSELYQENPTSKMYYAIDFEKFYVLNFQFWKELDIKRLYAKINEDMKVEKKMPFLYTIKHTPNKIDKYIFQVQRDSSKWYFTYFADPNTPVFW